MSLTNNCLFFDEEFDLPGDPFTEFEVAFDPLEEDESASREQLVRVVVEQPARTVVAGDGQKRSAVFRRHPRRNCRILHLGKQALATSLVLKEQLSLLNSMLHHCHSCASETDCPRLENLLIQVETAIQQLYQEWLG